MLTYILKHLEKCQSNPSPPPLAPPRIKPPPNLANRPSTIIPTRLPQSPTPVITSTSRMLTPPPSSSRASSTHSEYPKPPLHSRSWLEQEVAKLKQQQFWAWLTIRGRGSRPWGCQSHQPRQPPVFYQDHLPNSRGTSRPRGITKKSRPYRGHKKWLSESELIEYRKQNAAILSNPWQRKHDGAIPFVNKFGYIPLEPSDSPIHNPHTNQIKDNQMDVDPATPPRHPRDDRAPPELDENPQQRCPISERLGRPLRPTFPSSSTSTS